MPVMDSPFNKKRFIQNPTIRLSKRVMMRKVPFQETSINQALSTPLVPDLYPEPVFEIYHDPPNIINVDIPVIEEPVAVSIVKKTRKKRK